MSARLITGPVDRRNRNYLLAQPDAARRTARSLRPGPALGPTRESGTFAEALRGVPPFGADLSAAASGAPDT